MEERKLTQEELFEAEAAFNLASLLGRSIQAAAFSIRHPDYEPEQIVWLDKPVAPPDTDDDDEEEEEEPEENDASLPDPLAAADTPGLPVIHSNEASIDAQIEQLTALYIPELHTFLKTSALYDMFHLAASQFNFDLKSSDPTQELSASDKKKAALAWIIVKRVFAVRHTQETLLIISATERAVRNAPAIPFLPMDDTDRQFITETCALIADTVIEDEDPITATLATIAQIPPQDERYIALANKAFREQRAIAARNRFTSVSVGNNVTIQARIGKEGEPPVELSEFEMLIEQSIGEIIQYQTRLQGEKCLPIAISPEQLYRWIVYDGSSDATVSQQQREMVIQAFDKLIQTPAELHILEQLEKHTKLKSKPSYKKLLKNEGVMVGNLVTGMRVSLYRYNDKIINDALVIYSMPMFFYYSAFTGQLLKVDRKLLTGEDVKKNPSRNTAYDSILRNHILYRLNLIRQELKEKNKKIAQQAKYHGGKQKPFATYTKVILLATLAEECKVSLETPKKLEVFRNKVLDYMQELKQKGEIKAYEPKYESRRITGVSVTIGA